MKNVFTPMRTAEDLDLIEIEKIYGVIVKEIGNITDRYNQKINIISS